jgi:hypothetical protein
MIISNDKHELVLDFIKQFRDLGSENCFSNGMCFWFAHILSNRFQDEDGVEVMYDEVANHFGCRINNIVYDITGIVTTEYDWRLWRDMDLYDHLLTMRIQRDCVDKVPAGVQLGSTCTQGYFDDWGTYICAIDHNPCGWNEQCHLHVTTCFGG